MKGLMVKMKKMTFIAILVVLLCSPVIVLAVSKSTKYADMYVDCTCKITASKGTATTVGSVKPYSNYALIIVYNKDGKSKGSDVDYGLPITGEESCRTATAAVSGKIGLKKALSNHAIADKNKNLIGGYDELIVLTAIR